MPPRATSAGLLGGLLIVVVLASGCGGSEGRFAGPRQLPAGFEVARGTRASFGHPAAWAAAARSAGRSRIITARAPADAGGTTPSIELREIEDLRGSFDNTVAARRSFATGSGEDRSGETEGVEVAGAARASLYRGEVSFGGTRYDNFDLAILTDDGAGIFFSAIVPAGGDVDADTVLESLRLGNG